MSGKKGTMVLFVRGLPQTTTPKELREYFQQLVKRRWSSVLSGQGVIGACDIMRITNRDNNQTEYHGLVEIQPATLALNAMRKLNGAEFHGKTIEVRRYCHRSSFRDRRKDLPESQPINRRENERRRDGLTVELVDWRSAGLLPSLSRMLQQTRIAKSYGA